MSEKNIEYYIKLKNIKRIRLLRKELRKMDRACERAEASVNAFLKAYERVKGLREIEIEIEVKEKGVVGGEKK